MMQVLIFMVGTLRIGCGSGGKNQGMEVEKRGEGERRHLIDEDKGKGSSTGTKSISERLQEEVRDAKIRILSSLKRNSEEERMAWNEFSGSLKKEFPNYTPLLAKILEGLVSGGSNEDKIHLNKEIINAANDVIESINKDELAKWISIKSDPEDEEAETIKKKMEATRDQLAEALYRKGLALVEIDSVKVEQEPLEESTAIPSDQSDKFEENFKELKKWVEIKSPKYYMLLVVRERRNGRLGIALKVLNDMIQDDSEPPKKKLYDLKIQLLDEIGWSHVASYERRWMHVRFPLSLPLF